MKLGFVTRTSRTDAENHLIVGMQSIAPAAFAQQVSPRSAVMTGGFFPLKRYQSVAPRNVHTDTMPLLRFTSSLFPLQICGVSSGGLWSLFESTQRTCRCASTQCAIHL